MAEQRSAKSGLFPQRWSDLVRAAEKLRVMNLGALGTYAVTEVSLAPLGDVSFNGLPVVFLIPNFFAVTADGKNALQKFDLAREASSLVGEKSNQEQDGETNKQVHDYVSLRNRATPEKGEAKPNRGQGNREDVAKANRAKPGSKPDGNDESDRKLDCATRK